MEKDILEWEPTGFRGRRPLGELGRADGDLSVPPEEGDHERVCPPPRGLPASPAGRLPSARGASPSALIVAPAWPRQSALMNQVLAVNCALCV